MQRYFVDEKNWINEKVTITGSDAHHIERVMRYKKGDYLIAVAPSEEAFLCQIESIEKDMVTAVIREQIERNPELPLEVTIAQALPKQNKLEFVLQKGTELGASHFLLFQSERSIAKWDEKRGQKKLERFQSIVKEASEQAHRNRIPTITVKKSLAEIIELKCDYTLTLFAYEEEAKSERFSSLATALKTVKENDAILLIIGPEGGFSKEEAENLIEHGFQPVRLGKRILRTETASLYALASISYHFEELRCT